MPRPTKRLTKRKTVAKYAPRKKLAKRKTVAKRALQKRLTEKQEQGQEQELESGKPAARSGKTAARRAEQLIRSYKRKLAKGDYHAITFAEMREVSIEQGKNIDKLLASTTELKESSIEQRKSITELRVSSTEQRKSITELRVSSTEQRKSITELKESTTELRVSSTEQAKSISQLRETVGAHARNWGDLTEALTIGDARELFSKEGYDLVKMSNNVIITTPDGKSQEIDGLAVGKDVAIVMEAKTYLTKSDVKLFIKRKLEVFTELDPDTVGKSIFGAVGYLKATPATIEYAHQHGLYVIRAKKDTKELVPPPQGFKAHNFHP